MIVISIHNIYLNSFRKKYSSNILFGEGFRYNVYIYINSMDTVGTYQKENISLFLFANISFFFYEFIQLDVRLEKKYLSLSEKLTHIGVSLEDPLEHLNIQ